MPNKNILLIHTDQQRYDSLGSSGSPFARTPNLDRLAAQGTVFSRHIVSNPICSPSRASLLTGLYPPGHNVWCNGVALNRKEYLSIDHRYEVSSVDIPGGFSPEPATLADICASAGYDTVSFGKLHLTPNMAPEALGYPESVDLWKKGLFTDWHGPYYGFRHVDMTMGHGEQPCHIGHYAKWLQNKHHAAYRRLVEAPLPQVVEGFAHCQALPLPFELHHSAWLAQRFIEYLANRPAGHPFFAFIGFPDPHHSFTPCQETVDSFINAPVQTPVDPQGAGIAGSPLERQNQHRLTAAGWENLSTVLRFTYAMVNQIDRAVGLILDALESAGLAEETVVAFTSDHGDYMGDHGYLYKGYAASNALLHTPLIIRAPGSSLPTRFEAPVSNVDVLPTLAALAGVAVPTWQDGVDLNRLGCTEQEHCAFAFCANGDLAAVNYTVYDATHRLTWYPGSDFVELFDHTVDPGECRNVAALPENRSRVAWMKDLTSRQLAASYNPILSRSCAW